MIWGLACEIISPKAHVQGDLPNPRLAFLLIWVFRPWKARWERHLLPCVGSVVSLPETSRRSLGVPAAPFGNWSGERIEGLLSLTYHEEWKWTCKLVADFASDTHPAPTPAS